MALNDGKRLLVIPIDEQNMTFAVEVCLDYDSQGDMYIMRIESLDTRILMMVDGGKEPFVTMFEKFVEDFNMLKEAPSGV